MLVLEGLVCLHRTVQLQLLQHYWRGIDLDYHDIERFASEMNRDHSVVFETASKYCILDSFVDYDATPFLLRDFFPQFVVIQTVKGFGIVNKAEIDVFLELSCFLWAGIP